MIRETQQAARKTLPPRAMLSSKRRHALRITKTVKSKWAAHSGRGARKMKRAQKVARRSAERIRVTSRNTGGPAPGPPSPPHAFAHGAGSTSKPKGARLRAETALTSASRLSGKSPMSSGGPENVSGSPRRTPFARVAGPKGVPSSKATSARPKAETRQRCLVAAAAHAKPTAERIRVNDKTDLARECGCTVIAT